MRNQAYKVLFASDRPLGRCENITAVYDAYDGPKEFVQGVGKVVDPGDWACIVSDEIPPPREKRNRSPIIFIGHGLTGGKSYGVDDTPWWTDGAAHITYAICSSSAGVGIMSGQLDIDESRVLPLGMPRTDAYVGKRKGDGGTALANRRAYLYAPTFRGDRNTKLPNVNWAKLDSLLNDGEVLAVKRHMLTHQPLCGNYRHIVELTNTDPSTPFLIDCDVLATDYSSILFDGYLLGKPSVLVTDDMDSYLASRGMYMRYPHEYGSRWLNLEGREAAFVDELRRARTVGMGETESLCLDRVADACDGHSTERVIELIREVAWKSL